jgi:hypothetical protein
MSETPDRFADIPESIKDRLTAEAVAFMRATGASAAQVQAFMAAILKIFIDYENTEAPQESK